MMCARRASLGYTMCAPQRVARLQRSCMAYAPLVRAKAESLAMRVCRPRALRKSLDYRAGVAAMKQLMQRASEQRLQTFCLESKALSSIEVSTTARLSAAP